MADSEKYNLSFFNAEKWSFVLIQDNKIIYKSQSQGLKPLVFCLKKYKQEMKGAVVFDKIVGLAAAKLLVYGKVAEVLTPTISRDARKYLQANKIKLNFKKEVKNILSRNGNNLCPMEKMVKDKNIKEICKIFKIK